MFESCFPLSRLMPVPTRLPCATSLHGDGVASEVCLWALVAEGVTAAVWRILSCRYAGSSVMNNGQHHKYKYTLMWSAGPSLQSPHVCSRRTSSVWMLSSRSLFLLGIRWKHQPSPQITTFIHFCKEVESRHFSTKNIFHINISTWINSTKISVFIICGAFF